MAKKNKGIKLKQYRVPPEKFLVVINPWGIYGNFDAADLNHIGAWFHTMLRDDYPKVRVRAIFYQRTHRNIIVELPREVEIEQYLGAHHYSKFFLNAGHSEEIAYIYEYKYATFGDPSDKNFSMGHPMYDVIPPDFPIKYPYPLSSPAPPPPMDVPYARAIPPEISDMLAARHDNRPAELRPNSSWFGPSLSSGAPMNSNVGKGKAKDVNSLTLANGGTPHVQPNHLNSTPIDNTDVSSQPTKSGLPDKEPYGNDTADEAQTFLASLLSSVKTEETEGDLYEPSAELLKAFSTLPEDLRADDPPVDMGAIQNIKTEPVEPELTDYDPSDELLAALATLPEDMLPSNSKKDVILPRNHDIKIKEEPSDPISIGFDSFASNSPGLRKAHRTFGLDVRLKPGNAQFSNASSKRPIKHEQKDSPPKRIKTEY